jgi:hypothetical protein
MTSKITLLNFIEVDDSLYMADMSELDGSGIWTIRLPDSVYGNNPSELFDCAIRDNEDDQNSPIKHLGSFETFRKAKEYLFFLWSRGKTYDNLENETYISAPQNYEFDLP